MTELINQQVQQVDVDTKHFELLQRKAQALSKSKILPSSFHNNFPDCFVALELASRLRCDPFQVMQNLHVIQGRPTWSAQFLIALFNACGRYRPIEYEFSDDKTECTATTVVEQTGQRLYGPTITLDMARAEGWLDKKGSKWKTMPELMMRYRAASFLIRTTAPEIGVGLYTTEEMEDVQKPQVVEQKPPERLPDMHVDLQLVASELMDAAERDMERGDGCTNLTRDCGAQWWKTATLDADKDEIVRLVEVAVEKITKKRGEGSNEEQGDEQKTIEA